MSFKKEVKYSLCVFGLFLECLLWESLIAIGALPVNAHYREMFSDSEIGMMIVDPEGNIYSRSSGAPDITSEQFDMLKREKMIPLINGMELHISEISGGYVIWQRDTRELRERLNELEEKREELEAEDELLRAELNNRSAKERLDARKRLFEVLKEETKEDNDRILTIIHMMRKENDIIGLLKEAIVLAEKIKNKGIHLSGSFRRVSCDISGRASC